MKGWLPNMHFHPGDAHNNAELDAMLSSQPVFLFIDADKVLEVHIFAPMLQPGSMLLVHDFWSEVMLDDIRPVLEKSGIFMLYADVADAVRSHVRAFFVVGTANPLGFATSARVEGPMNMHLQAGAKLQEELH